MLAEGIVDWSSFVHPPPRGSGRSPTNRSSWSITFADQAVIAIENVRLFDEVQARTDELRESLQQQTATADVLKVISRSTFDLKSVLNTLVESAARLCDADYGPIFVEGDGVLLFAASLRHSPEYNEFMSERVRFRRDAGRSRAGLDRRSVRSYRRCFGRPGLQP